MIKVASFDVIFISYDEPNAEENYAHLLNDVPWVKRIHGVKGLDLVHKKAAEIAETDRVITIDGDNIVNSNFWNLEIEEDNFSYTWQGRNLINGLVYGNGGIKLWQKDFLKNMDHHETGVDFCWDEKYKHLPGVYSTTIQNGSALQAFRSGFREGVKLSLDRGKRTTPNNIVKSNLDRLQIWCSIGIDVPYGKEAIYGARLGCFYTMLDRNFNLLNLNNYDYIEEVWENHKNQIDGEYYNFLRNELVEKVGINIVEFNEKQSKFFKEVLIKTPLGDSLPDYYEKYMIL